MFGDISIVGSHLLLVVFFLALISIVVLGALWVRSLKKSNPSLYYLSKRKEKKDVRVEPYTIFRAVINAMREEEKEKNDKDQN